jgi:hypothetical protein
MSMAPRQAVIGITVVVAAVGGVFLGAGADASWDALTAPQYIIGSIVSGAAALGGFLSKSPVK